MEEIIYPINLDLRTNTHKVLVMKEGDYNSRVIEATITDNGKPFNIENCTVDIKWRKPDGHLVYSESTKINSSTIRVVCTEQMLCVSGISVAEIVITNSNSVVSTLAFNISVNETVASNFEIESSDEFSSLKHIKEHIANNDIHLPNGGSEGQLLKRNADGTAEWASMSAKNAETATKLQTPRKINGVPFDGSSDITLTPSDIGADASGLALKALDVAKLYTDTNITKNKSYIVSTTKNVLSEAKYYTGEKITELFNPDNTQTVDMRINGKWESIAYTEVDESLRSIIYANGKFLGIDTKGVVYSTDGVTWTRVTSNTSISAIGYHQDSDRFVYYDGSRKWYYYDGTSSAVGGGTRPSAPVRTIAYGNGITIAVDSAGKTYYTSDGITWAAGGTCSSGSALLNDIAYGDGKFVIVGDANVSYYSTDGNTWVENLVSDFNYDCKGIAYGNGKFVIVGEEGFSYYSEDGVIWLEGNTVGEETLNSIAFSDEYNMFVSVGDNGTSYYSEDGVNWYTKDIVSNNDNLSDVVYADGKFLAVGSTDGTFIHVMEIVKKIKTISETYAKKSLYDDTSINLGRKADTTVGRNSVALGIDVTASGDYSHAEGYVAEASGFYSHAEGKKTVARGNCSHAEGESTQATGTFSHAEGYFSLASGDRSHAEGELTKATGRHSHAEGYLSEANGMFSHAEGYKTIALENQHAQGHCNDTTLALANSSSGTSDGTAFVIGNGTASTASNAFRVTGKGVTYAKGAYNATGADYAEFSEWADGNQNNEDRRGYFVTFDEEKPNMIRKANEGDYILGIVSGNPCIIGNADEGWLGKYIFDEFGSIVYEDVEIEETYTDETGEEKTRTVKVNTYKINPDYDPTKEYVHREKRKEWDAIGWIGVLSVRDDGSCIAGGYCTVTDGGIATKADRGFDTYRVIKRVTDNVIKIALK